MNKSHRVAASVLVLLATCLASCGAGSSGNTNTAADSCGNGRRDLGEECEGSDLQGRTCLDFGMAGDLLCGADCTYDKISGCYDPMCGNGKVDVRIPSSAGACEQCDGTDFGGHSCAAFGGGTGTPSCEECGISSKSCIDLCGNGRLDSGETCDGVVPGELSCASLGLGEEGYLSCRIRDEIFTPSGVIPFPSCLLETSCSGGLGMCGNGYLEEFGEECDGNDFGGVTCTKLGFAGELRCNPDCRLDFSNCAISPGTAMCGNEMLEEGEECDGAALAPVEPVSGCNDDDMDLQSRISFSATANTVYYFLVTSYAGEGGILVFNLGGGSLPTPSELPLAAVPNDSCGSATEISTLPYIASIDTSSATATGDLVPSCGGGLDGNGVWYRFAAQEDGILTATTYGSNYDTVLAAYTGSCGSLIPVEEGADLVNCARTSRRHGLEICTEDCRIDREKCNTRRCGNGKVDLVDEECDGEDLRGLTCADVGGTGDGLGCFPTCFLDTSGCANLAGNGRREDGESCDYDFTSDSHDLGGASCESLGYGTGQLNCTFIPRATSTVDADHPLDRPLRPLKIDLVFLTRFNTFFCTDHAKATCGDGIATNGEACDGGDLAGATCATFDGEGELKCKDDCSYDLSGCSDLSVCGDTRISYGEECDRDKSGRGLFAGQSCEKAGGRGEYSCDEMSCFIDTTDCALECESDFS